MQPRPPHGYLPDSAGLALCRRYCSQILQPDGGAIGFSRGSADGLALCRSLCRGFAAGAPVTLRRPRRRPVPMEMPS